jgi:hypothetical protein
LFGDLLPGNDSFVAIRCSGNVIAEPLVSNGRPLWLHFYGFQAVFTEALSSNSHIPSQYVLHFLLTFSFSNDMRRQ